MYNMNPVSSKSGKLRANFICQGDMKYKISQKSPIFVVQKAAAPKYGVTFRQKFIHAVKWSLATSYDDW